MWEKACFKDKWLPAIVYARGEGKTHMGLKEDTPRNGEGRWGGVPGLPVARVSLLFFCLAMRDSCKVAKWPFHWA